MMNHTIKMEVILHTIVSGPKLVIGTITENTLYSILRSFMDVNADDNNYVDGMLEFRLGLDESKVEEVRLIPRYYDTSVNSMITDDWIDIRELVSNHDTENVLAYYKSYAKTKNPTIVTMNVGYCMSTYYPYLKTIKDTDYSSYAIEPKREPSDEYKKSVKEANKKIEASLYKQDILWSKYSKG